jgi:hypothetical protein
MPTTIPKALQTHAKKHGMTIATDPARKGVGIYRKGGRDLIAFNLADAEANPDELLKVLDKQIARMKRQPEG